MKQILILSAIAVAFGLAAHFIRAQEPTKQTGAGAAPHPDLNAARQRQRQLEQRLAEVLNEGQGQSEASRDVLERTRRQPFRDKVRQLVEESFEARQRLHRAELDQLRRQFGEIERAIETREKNKDVITNSRIDALLHAAANAKGEDATTFHIPNDSKSANMPTPKGATFPNVAGVPVTPRQVPRAPAGTGEFDIDTRERLAQLDLKAAEEDYVAAEKSLKQAEKGGLFGPGMLSLKEDQRRAGIAVERAKIKLAGIARQREELKSAAETAVAEAKAEVDKAAAKVQVAEANVAAVAAQTEQQKADVVAAEASVEFAEKRYERMKTLLEKRAIEERLLDETQDQWSAAKATLSAAKAKLSTGQANIDRAKAELVEARAEWDVAKQRLKAAEAQRDRFLGPKEDAASQESAFWIDPVSRNRYSVGVQYPAQA